MMRNLVFSLLSLVALPAVAQDLTALSGRVKPSVVHLTIRDSSGDSTGMASGFFITETGWIVTNHHVIDNAHGVEGILNDRSKIAVLGVLAQDNKTDLAILQAEPKEGAGYPMLSLAEGSVSEGLEVVVIGSPMGLSWTLSHGIVSAVRAEGIPEELKATRTEGGAQIQITAPISPGSSGSPVLNLEGQVIGVARATANQAGDLNFATPADEVRKLAASIDSAAEPQPFHPLPIHNLIISLIFFAALGLCYLVVRLVLRKRGAAAATTH